MQNQTWCVETVPACLSALKPPRVSAFFEEVAAQTGIPVHLQQLLYLGHDLPLEGNMKVVNLPGTSPERPLILLSYGPETITGLPFRERETIKDTCNSFDSSLFFTYQQISAATLAPEKNN